MEKPARRNLFDDDSDEEEVEHTVMTVRPADNETVDQTSGTVMQAEAEEEYRPVEESKVEDMQQPYEEPAEYKPDAFVDEMPAEQ